MAEPGVILQASIYPTGEARSSQLTLVPHFAPAEIAITYELLGQYLLFLDRSDHRSPWVRLKYKVGDSTSKSKVSCTA